VYVVYVRAIVAKCAVEKGYRCEVCAFVRGVGVHVDCQTFSVLRYFLFTLSSLSKRAFRCRMCLRMLLLVLVWFSVVRAHYALSPFSASVLALGNVAVVHTCTASTARPATAGGAVGSVIRTAGCGTFTFLSTAYWSVRR
jgi:hypothetical protein